MLRGMQFRELPLGAKFRMHRRGPERTKTSEDQIPNPDIEVIYEKPFESEPPAPSAPFGKYNKIEFAKAAVRLDGTFTAEQLEAVLAALKKREG